MAFQNVDRHGPLARLLNWIERLRSGYRPEKHYMRGKRRLPSAGE